MIFAWYITNTVDYHGHNYTYYFPNSSSQKSCNFNKCRYIRESMIVFPVIYVKYGTKDFV